MNVTVLEPNLSKTSLLCGDFSIELAPEMVTKFQPDENVLPQGSKVFLPHINGKDPRLQIDGARDLLSMGYTPIVHMGARNFDKLGDYVKLLHAHSENGVTHGLFLGGDRLKHTGPYFQALDLLRHEALADTGFTHAFISGYPEGHPDIDFATLERARAEKLEMCEARGLTPEIVTQFAFDGEKMTDWANNIALDAGGVPVRLGLAGVTSLPKLIKFAVMCGVGPSIAVLKKNASGLMNVMSERDPGEIIQKVEAGYRGATPLNLHFFPFGGWQKTLDWISVQKKG